MASNGRRPGRILIAEREGALASYAQTLRTRGYHTEAVGSAALALDRLEKGDADVAVLDDDLADPSGLDVLRAAHRKVPIILCASSWSVSRAVQAMKEGAWDYLARPIHPADLLLAVDSAFSAQTGAVGAALPAPPDAFEQRRQQAQKMELFGRLAAGVIHDFNNLLTIILGYCDILKANLPAHHPLRTYVDDINNAAMGGAGLTQQILDFVRNQAPEPGVLHLNVIILQMEMMLSRIVGQRIRIVTRLAPDLGPILAPSSQVEQIIMNLVVNARDAMPEGGELTLETANLDLSVPLGPLSPGPYVALRVSDTGLGMDEHTRAHLFQPFFTTKKQGAGTGLGLSMVASILHSLQGHITVDSTPGNGTTFTISLPRLVEAPNAGQ